MNISKVIENVRNIKTGYEVSDEQIISAINDVEMNIILNITNGRKDDKTISDEYGNYDINTDRSKELLAPAPYDNIYQYYVCSQIDLVYEDSERYAIDSVLYNNTFLELRAFWIKNHRQNKKYKYY